METCKSEDVCQSSLTTQIEDDMTVRHTIRRGCSAPIDAIRNGTNSLLLSVNSNTTSCNYENSCDGTDCSDGTNCQEPFKNKALQCDEHNVNGTAFYAGSCLPADGSEDWTIPDVNCFECYETMTGVRSEYDKCLDYPWAEGGVITCRHSCAKTLTDTVEIILSNPTDEIITQYIERTVERGCHQSFEQSSSYDSTSHIYQCLTNNCNIINFAGIPDFCIPQIASTASTVMSTAITIPIMTSTTIFTSTVTSPSSWSSVAVAGLTMGCCMVIILITFFVIALISPYGVDWLCAACGVASDDQPSLSQDMRRTGYSVEPDMEPTQTPNGQAPANSSHEKDKIQNSQC